jgi:hypothetical protein
MPSSPLLTSCSLNNIFEPSPDIVLSNQSTLLFELLTLASSIIVTVIGNEVLLGVGYGRLP